jgi:HAE1 family hydrophobic/amphiphilic exporter-1
MLDLIFRKRVGVLLLYALLCACGIVLVSRLPVQLYPRTDRPRLMTTFRHEGYSAIGFSQEFSDLIEPKLMSLDGVDFLEARYGSDQSTFTITFDWKVDAKKAQADAQAAVSAIVAQLPSALQESTPRVRFFTGENAGYLMLGLSSPTVSPEVLYKTLVTSVEPELSGVKDVELVEIFNVEDLSATIVLRPLDLLSRGLTISDVNTAMRTNHATQSIGSLREAGGRSSVRFSRGEIGLFDLAKLPIVQVGDVTVRLEDIADVSVSYTIPQSTFVMDGSRGIQVTATPIEGGNIRAMSREVTRLLREARDEGVLPADTQITPFLDPTEYIDRSIGSVLEAAVIGAGLAMLIVLLTLGEVRNTLLIGISIPTSLFLSFILMYAFGVSLNLISLGGMALAVGMIVDAAIVVMENIHRFRADENHSGDDRHLRDLIIRATGQVRDPVISSVLTSILVFLPLSFTAPLTNAILGDQARVVVYTLSFSLIVSLTLIPLLAYVVYRSPRRRTSTRTWKVKTLALSFTNLLVRGYTRLLRPVVSRRGVALAVIAASAALFGFSVLVILPRIPREILTPPKSDRLVLFMQSVGEVTSEEMVETVLPEMERTIHERLGRYVESTYAEIRGRFNRLFIVLKSTRDIDHVTNELQRIFVSDNQWYYSVMNWDPAEMPLPRTNDLQISLAGEDQTVIVGLLERIRDAVSNLSLYGWVFTTPTTNYTNELHLSPRLETISSLKGYDEASLISLVQRALTGTQVMEFEHEGETVSARARYPDEYLRGRDRLENFLVPYEETAVPLKHFFDFSESTSVSQIVTEDGEPVFRVYASMRRGEPASNRLRYERKVREELAKAVDLPAGYTLTFDNPQQQMDEAIRSLFISLAISIVLVYLLLAFEFNSLVVPLLILVTVPLGFIGLLVSLFVFRSTICLNSLLGAILLAGTAVNNAIVFVDFYKKSLSEYSSRVEALVDVARLRFLPIYITSLTTIVGMLPLAIGLGEGSNVVKPLGIAVSGGLLVSTGLTLFVLPAILSLSRTRAKE